MRKIVNKKMLFAISWEILIAWVLVACMQLDTIEDSVSSSSNRKYRSSSSSISKIIMQVSPTKLDTTGISYYEAILICNKMSIKEGLDTLYKYDSLSIVEGSLFWLQNLKVLENRSGYRLPTMEEWEQAEESGKIIDANGTVGEWIYREANSPYALFYIAPSFVKATGLYKKNPDNPAYGMRVLKVTVY